jgi:hypothetical protein
MSHIGFYFFGCKVTRLHTPPRPPKKKLVFSLSDNPKGKFIKTLLEWTLVTLFRIWYVFHSWSTKGSMMQGRGQLYHHMGSKLAGSRQLGSIKVLRMQALRKPRNWRWSIRREANGYLGRLGQCGFVNQPQGWAVQERKNFSFGFTHI